MKSTGEPMSEAGKPCQSMAENDPASLKLRRTGRTLFHILARELK
jgi:hypothetical protein